MWGWRTIAIVCLSGLMLGAVIYDLIKTEFLTHDFVSLSADFQRTQKQFGELRAEVASTWQQNVHLFEQLEQRLGGAPSKPSATTGSSAQPKPAAKKRAAITKRPTTHTPVKEVRSEQGSQPPCGLGCLALLMFPQGAQVKRAGNATTSAASPQEVERLVFLCAGSQTSEAKAGDSQKDLYLLIRGCQCEPNTQSAPAKAISASERPASR